MTTAPTPAMQARASVLLSHADRWSRGTRNEDGEPFFLFAGSKGAVYFCAEQGCTCPSFRHRGTCSHHVAVIRYAERRAEAEIDLAHEFEIEQALADAARCRSCGERTTDGTFCRPCRERLLGYGED